MEETAAKKSTFSRIPKFNMSFRKTLHASDTTNNLDNRNSVKTPPSSKESSPTISRSKSLRLPRNNYKSHSSSALSYKEKVEEKDGQTGVYNEQQLKPRSRSGTFSNSSSRAGSPGVHHTYDSHSHTDSSSSSTCNSLKVHSTSGSSFTRRTQSFSARTRPQRFSGGGRLTSGNVKERNESKPAGRSKTPTGTSRIPSPIPDHITGGPVPNQTEPQKLQLSRSTSHGHVSRNRTTQLQQPSSQSRKVQRTDHGGGAVSNWKSSNRSDGLRGKRSSSALGGGTADLNKLAEITNSFSAHEADISSGSELEVKSISKLRSRFHISTAKGVECSHDGGSTPSPTGNKSYEQPTLSSQAKLLNPRRPSIDRSLRPSSARANYRNGGSNERAEIHRPQSVTALLHDRDEPDGQKLSTMCSRSSTPSSGRSTPVHRTEDNSTARRTSSGSRSRLSPTPDSSSRVSRLPPRTPYRVPRTKAPQELAGMNELAGSVLLEADDYRRISNEVKSLKTMLLKLKREIQGDVSHQMHRVLAKLGWAILLSLPISL